MIEKLVVEVHVRKGILPKKKPPPIEAEREEKKAGRAPVSQETGIWDRGRRKKKERKKGKKKETEVDPGGAL